MPLSSLTPLGFLIVVIATPCRLRTRDHAFSLLHLELSVHFKTSQIRILKKNFSKRNLKSELKPSIQVFSRGEGFFPEPSSSSLLLSSQL